MSWPRIDPWRVAFALALVGLATSVFLSWEYSRSDVIACPLTGTGCDEVRASEYSRLLGVPVPWYGVAYYATVGALLILRLEAGRRELAIARTLLAATVTGAGVSAWLTYLEAFVIGAWCSWCLVSAACAVGLPVFVAIGGKSVEA